MSFWFEAVPLNLFYSSGDFLILKFYSLRDAKSEKGTSDMLLALFK